MKISNPIVALGFVIEKSGMPNIGCSFYSWAAKIFDSPDAWFRLARNAFQNNAWDNGIRYFTEVIRCRPNHAESNFKLGICRMKRGMWHEAIASIGAAIELDPEKTQWRTQYNEALGKVGKRPWTPDVFQQPRTGIPELVQILQALVLRGEFEAFDTLYALVQTTAGSEAPNEPLLSVIESLRFSAEGNLEMSSVIATNTETEYGLYLKSQLSYSKGDYEESLDKMSEFLSENTEGEYFIRLLARYSRLSGHPDIGRRALLRLLGKEPGGESASWRELSLFMESRSYFDRMMRLWLAFKKIYKVSPYYLKVGRHVATGAARSGNRNLAEKLLQECLMATRKKKLGPPIDLYQEMNHPEYPNLLESLISMDGVSVKAFSKVDQRYFFAAHTLVELLNVSLIDCAIIRGSCQFFIDHTVHPDLHDVIEFGIIGQSDLASVYQAISHCSSFHVLAGFDPLSQVIEFKHANGISFRAYVHQAAGDCLVHSRCGVEWKNRRFKVRSVEVQGFTFPLPSDLDSYIAEFFPDDQHCQRSLGFMVAAQNMCVTGDQEYRCFLYDTMLEFTILGDEAGIQACVKKLCDVGDISFVQRYYGANGNYVDANLPQLLNDKPQVVLYLSGLENVAYQGNQWIPVLEKLTARCAIAIRERRIASQLMPSKLPVYYFESLRELEYLEQAGIKTVLYPANPQKATQSLRLHRLNHFFINHGESDKVVNQSKFLMAYDKLLVAGPLAERRLRDAGLPIREDQIVHVGRPQVELFLNRTTGKTAAIKTIFYAPTWEGFNEEANYSSINSFGVSMLQALAACGDCRVVFKPHPYTGQSNPNEAGVCLKEMLQIAKRSKIQVLDSKESIFDSMNQSDLLITDVSSVLNDYLYTLKPMVLTNPRSQSHDKLRLDYPSTAATYILDKSADVIELIKEIATADSMLPSRQRVCRDSLGEFEEGSLATFNRVIQASIDTQNLSM
jgi:tetratricopeptide (TPR) repeat protein